MNPKYSILIPVFNGMEFLPQTIPSILKSGRHDFELLVSDDGSDDSSLAFLRGFSDKRLRVFEAPSHSSMAEHWEWLSTKANGDWQMFLGQDDALQEYFFEAADQLTEFAESQGTHLVTAKRAYLNWPGMGSGSDLRQAIFRAQEEIKVKNLRLATWLTLAGIKSYHELPQMYTSTLVSGTLLQEVREAQKQRLIVAHPQDASLAASLALFSRTYVYSATPLSWVGTSVRSAGRAVELGKKNAESKSTQDKVLSTYVSDIEASKLAYPAFAGPFSLGDATVYFWQAIYAARRASGKSTAWLRNPALVLWVVSAVFRSSLPFSPRFWSDLAQVRTILSAHRLNAQICFLPFLLVSALGGLLAVVKRALRAHRNSLRSTSEKSPSNFVINYDDKVLNLQELNSMAADAFYRRNETRG